MSYRAAFMASLPQDFTPDQQLKQVVSIALEGTVLPRFKLQAAPILQGLQDKLVDFQSQNTRGGNNVLDQLIRLETTAIKAALDSGCPDAQMSALEDLRLFGSIRAAEIARQKYAYASTPDNALA